MSSAAVVICALKVEGRIFSVGNKPFLQDMTHIVAELLSLKVFPVPSHPTPTPKIGFLMTELI